jgi:FKBP-type peptidyl-prolyl cis-trans isomerase 2
MKIGANVYVPGVGKGRILEVTSTHVLVDFGTQLSWCHVWKEKVQPC